VSRRLAAAKLKAWVDDDFTVGRESKRSISGPPQEEQVVGSCLRKTRNSNREEQLLQRYS
jgi:hypothetical protein